MTTKQQGGRKAMPRIAPLAQNEPGTDAAPEGSFVQGEAAEAAVAELGAPQSSLAEEIVAGGQAAVMRMIASEPGVVARNFVTLAKENAELRARLAALAPAGEDAGDVGGE